MHKVIIERPRRNPGRKKLARRANLPDELQPKFQGIRRPHEHRKRFTDVLGPLRRWLQSQVGRPWNDVYSEACTVIKPNSVVRSHLKTHLLAMVQWHTFRHQGEVCVIVPYYGGGLKHLTELRYSRHRYFVHPETRLLAEIPRRPRAVWRDPLAVERFRTIRWLNETKLLRLCHGCWFECQMEKFPERYEKGQGDSPWRFDLVEKKLINRSQARDAYGKVAYCTAKRQLSRKELKRFGLTNVTMEDETKPERSGQQVITITG